MYDKILVPTDGSEGSEVALDHATRLARQYDSEIHLIYVADVRTQNTGDVMANFMGELEKIGEEAVMSMREELDEIDDVITKVIKGIPHREIIDYSDEEEIDLIVMGTHGRTGLDRILLGSVTEKVVRTSEVPVMTVGRED